MKRTCGSCVLKDKTNNFCQLLKFEINPDRDVCPKYLKEFEFCEICRQPLLPQSYILDMDKKEQLHQICQNCNRLLSSCQACSNFSICPFETDPNPMPKVVVKTMQQGNMTMQTQVRNEEREALFCHNCCCWQEETGCLKNYNIGCEKKTEFWN